MLPGRRSFMGMSAAGIGALVFGRAASLPTSGQPGPLVIDRTTMPKLPVGMNLAPIADWETGYPFKNLLWGARPWEMHNADGSGPWGNGKPVHFQFDEDGYPLEVPITVPGLAAPQSLFALLPNVRKPGKYVLLHDGEGSFGGLMGTRVISAKPGRVLLQMTHRTGLVEGIFIKRSVAGNHVRNIRIVPLEFEKDDLEKNPFLPEFLDFCRPFHALRFMDWGQINGSIEGEWSARKRPTFYTMVGKGGDADGFWGPKPSAYDMMFAGGVAIEIMIKLANLLAIDPWLCIPHRATDEYIAQYAKLVRSKLDPRRKVYLEYSNEIWNWGFNQSQWMIRSRLAGDLVDAGGGKGWDDAAKTKGGNFPERVGALFRRAFSIWEREWQGADRKRLVCVCAIQTGWTDVAIRTARWCAAHGGADALAGTGYFGAGDAEYQKWAQAGAALTADEVVQDMMQLIMRSSRGTGYAALAALAKELGMAYVSYEGGQHLQPKNQADLPYNPALGAAQSHPGMYDLYVENMRLQKAMGNQLFCAFSSVGPQGSRFGSWGAKATYDQPLSEAPKLRALLDCNTPRSS